MHRRSWLLWTLESTSEVEFPRQTERTHPVFTSKPDHKHAPVLKPQEEGGETP